MDLRALRTFRFGSENIRRGMPVTMSEARAKDHLTRGLVEEASDEKLKADPKPKSKPKGDEKAEA